MNKVVTVPIFNEYILTQIKPYADTKGSKLIVEQQGGTGEATICLCDANNNKISSVSIDLPDEKEIVKADLDYGHKKIIFTYREGGADISHKLTNVATARDLTINRGAEVSSYGEPMSIPSDNLRFSYETSVDWYVDGALLKSSSTYLTVGDNSYSSSYDVAIAKFDTLTVTSTSRIDITLEKIGSGDRSFQFKNSSSEYSVIMGCTAKGWSHTFTYIDMSEPVEESVYYSSGDSISLRLESRYGSYPWFNVILNGEQVEYSTSEYSLNTSGKKIDYITFVGSGGTPQFVISTSDI